MSQLADLLRRFGETDPHDNYDFDIEESVAFADFFNNGGLEFHLNGLNYALVYAALYDDGNVKIGAWAWLDGEDFDEKATFEVYEEDDFSGGEIDRIYKRIKEIYGHD